MSDKGPWGRRSGGTRLYALALTPLTTTNSNAVTGLIDADEVMLHARTQACKVALGPTPDASSAYTFILEAGERFHIKLARNADKISAVSLTGSGSLEITPCK